MIDGLKENIFIVTNQMLGDLLSLSSSRELHCYYIQNVEINQSKHRKRDEQLCSGEEFGEGKGGKLQLTS